MFNNSKGEDRMRNKLSYNQMAEWIHTESISGFDQDTLIDEYFDCIIDCEDNATQCRQVCTEILK